MFLGNISVCSRKLQRPDEISGLLMDLLETRETLLLFDKIITNKTKKNKNHISNLRTGNSPDHPCMRVQYVFEEITRILRVDTSILFRKSKT